MRQFILLLIVVAAGYFGFTELLPRYEAWKASKAASADSSEEAELSRACVSAAAGAYEQLDVEAEALMSGSFDRRVWAATLIRLGSALTAADDQCACESRSCRSGAGAMLETRRLLTQLDGAARGDGDSLRGASARRRTIKQLLADARASLP